MTQVSIEHLPADTELTDVKSERRGYNAKRGYNGTYMVTPHLSTVN